MMSAIKSGTVSHSRFAQMAERDYKVRVSHMIKSGIVSHSGFAQMAERDYKVSFRHDQVWHSLPLQICSDGGERLQGEFHT